MLNFPKEAKVERFIPKKSFYEKANLSRSEEDIFAREIEKITLAYVFRKGILNLSAKKWKEIDVIRIDLKDGIHDISEEIIEIIDNALPRPVIFEIVADEYSKVIIGYKTKNEKNGKVSISRYFDTKWSKNTSLQIDGLSVDNVYVSFIRQVAGDDFSDKESNSTLGSIEHDISRVDNKERIMKQIARLERDYRREFSVSKRNEIARELHELKSQLG